MGRLKSRLGALGRELALHLALPRRRAGTPSVLFFPSQGTDDGAARLRAYAMARELTALGWRTAVCPKHLGLAARRRLVRRFAPDLAVMQTARHPLNRPHLFPGLRVVIDLDDADYIDPVSAEPLVRALQDSVGAIAGSRSVARFCRRYTAPVTVVWTGTPPSADAPPAQHGRPPVVTWAASSPVGSPHEVALLAQVLDRLAQRGVDLRFRVYSDDGSEGYRAMMARLVPAGMPCETRAFMGYEAFLGSLDDVAVGLAPLVDLDGFSGGKSFGKVLAYIDRGVPVVTQPVVDHPLFFRHGENGLIVDTVAEWADAIVALLADAAKRDRIAAVARADLRTRLSTEAAARLTDRFLRALLP